MPTDFKKVVVKKKYPRLRRRPVRWALGSVSTTPAPTPPESILGSFRAFPGAMGWNVTGSELRNWATPESDIRHVINLNNDGVGSLRAACTSSAPSGAVVVFDVEGIITLLTQITAQENIYIAGQTAPGKGTLVKGAGIEIRGNTIMRHMRVAAGDLLTGPNMSQRDSARIGSYQDFGGKAAIIDHCTVLWGVDGTLDVCFGNGYANVTNTIIAETLQDVCTAHPDRTVCPNTASYTAHPENPGHSCGMLLPSNTHDKNVALLRNLFGGSAIRQPLIGSHGTYVISNNWTVPGHLHVPPYDPYYGPFFSLGYDGDNGHPCKAIMEGNVCKKGRYQTGDYRQRNGRIGFNLDDGAQWDSASGHTAFFIVGVGETFGIANDIEQYEDYGSYNLKGIDWNQSESLQYRVTSKPFSEDSSISVMSASLLSNYLTSYVGARPAHRLNRAETRIVADFITNPNEGRTLDGVEADSGESPSGSANYVQGPGPNSGSYGTGWPNDLGSATSTWQTPNDRWGVNNWDQVPGEAAGWTYMDKALHLDHLSVGGEPVGT